MNNYNLELTKYREEKGLSIKDAAKQMGMSRLKLFLYENGYFRPSKKNLDKINKFYDIDLSFVGESGYPAPNKKLEKEKHGKNLKGKRIAYGILSAFALIFVTVGTVLFTISVNNTDTYYGEAYQRVHSQVVNRGEFGHDLVTSMKYYYVNEKTDISEQNIVFYSSNNIMYFNEIDYSKTSFNGSWNMWRRHYHFGFDLGVNSYLCKFTYSNVVEGCHFTCDFIFNGQPVTEVSNFKLLVAGTADPTDQFVIEAVNEEIMDVNPALSKLMSELTGTQIDFYNDYLPAREQGRVVNFALQILGLIFLFSGIIMFFIFFTIYLRLMTKNIKPRMVPLTVDKEEKEPLPEDWRFKIGIPDYIVVTLSKIMQFGSMGLFFVAFLAQLGLPFVSIFSDPIFLSIFRWIWMSGVFLEYFVMIQKIKKPAKIFHEIIYNLMVFLFIATFETVAISITSAWGYDLAGLIYKYVPGNVYQVVAINYIIYLFLFFQPSFLNNKKSYVRVLWHCLSLIPLLALVATYIISNSYALMYGVQANIYLNFWFPNAFLLLSVVSVLFVYATFFIRLYYEKKYGEKNSQTFFYGDKYTLIENAICALLILVVTSIDFAFMNNQYAYYLGLGVNFWMYILIPLIFFCKYSPNSQQAFIIDQINRA